MNDAPRPDWRVHAALLIVQVTFGAFPVVGKGVLVHLPPLAVAALRVALATPILLALAWRVDRVLPARRDLPTLFLLGLLGVFANQVLFMIGLELTTATAAGILMPSIPVFALLAAAVLGQQRLTTRSATGVALAVAGALAILNPMRLAGNPGGTLGNGLILLNCLAFAMYLVLQRPVLRRLPPLTTVAWSFLLGGSGVVVVGLPALVSVQPAALPTGVWIGLAYIVLFPTVLNYFLNAWSLGRSSPALVAAYTTLQPLVAAGLAALFLRESLHTRHLLGFLLISAGLAAISRPGGMPAGTGVTTPPVDSAKC